MTLSKLVSFLNSLFSVLFIIVLTGSIGILYLVYHYGKNLPVYSQLEQYTPPTVTRLYAADGRIMEEYATEHRIFIPINAIPKKLIHAFMSAEDKNFYNHPGIDIFSIVRAAAVNISNAGSNKPLVGGSTITQQVVKNFLLTKEQSLDRKIKEAILAFRITQAFSKDKIMELYLNEIYLGNRSYGVAAAALNYFNKSIDELTIEEVAMLASLPKSPSTLDPDRFPEKAIARRNWVISRMYSDGFITKEAAAEAIKTPIVTAQRADSEIAGNSDFFSETVRQEVAQLYGEKSVYEDGLAVRTTLIPQLQNYAQEALRKGLLSYDKKHGYRGPIAKINNIDNYLEELVKIKPEALLDEWEIAVVTGINNKEATIALDDNKKGVIPLENLKWAKKYINEDRQGSEIKKPSDVLSKGDVIAVRLINDSKGENYFLEQIPQVNGSIVALDPHTGKVLAMVGGYYYGGSQFNRAIQAQRQPGSAFKPFVYMAALENGFNPNSIIIDEEISLNRGHNLPSWKPQNYSGKFYGPTTLRVGVEESRNVMTVRLAQELGIDKIVKTAETFDIYNNPDRNYAVVLGSDETTLVKLTNAYAMLVNGGKRITPSLIERIQDRNGKTIYKRDNRDCTKCIIVQNEENEEIPVNDITPPDIIDNRMQISDPIATFQIVSILEGVVQRGTGVSAQSIGKILAGKTGTTNDSFDAWFVGFSADLAVGVYVGFDNPRSLGKKETGASAALPIWKDFMEKALQDKPDIPFRRPSGVKLVKIDLKTGLLASPSTLKSNIIYEAFRAGTEPTSSSENNYSSTNDNGDSISNELSNEFNSEGVY
jgi:penicillin-binding protein 1A